MSLTTNIDIDYIAKDFTSVVDALISFATVNYGANTSANRLWTNFNSDSFSRNWLEILAYVSDLFFFYFDQQATEAYLQTARLTSSVELIAQQFGFTPGSATSSSGVASFTVTGAGSIPRGFRTQASNGSQFYTTTATTVVGAGTVNISVLQGIINTETFTSQGVQSEEILLKGPNVIMDSTNLVPSDISPIVTVSGNTYSLVTSFIRNNGTDTPAIFDSLGNLLGGGGRVYTLATKPDGSPFIQFGDGVFGRKLQSGEVVSVTYRTGGGSAGNIPSKTLTSLLDSNSIITSVINNAAFSGGADAQSITQLRQLIPASLRTLNRAVTAQDYADIVTTNFTEVFAANAETNTQNAGIDLNLYVVPQGSGITQISANTVLKNKISNFVDRRKMVTTQFQILDAFGIAVLIGLEVHINNTASQTTVLTALQTALQNYFSLTTGGPEGSGIGFAQNILLKDIDNVIETISGIDRFEVKELTYRPRVQDNVVGLITSYANSDISIFPQVSESEWLLAASGQITRTSGTVLLSNTGLVAFSYDSATGLITYSFPVNLLKVAPGDLFRDGSNTDFTILAVNTTNNTINLTSALTINNTVSNANHGSIRSGATNYDSFKCFKKTLGAATNLSIDSITDINLDMSVLKSTAAAINARVLLDNTKVFIPGQYATGKFYLVDTAGHIWQINANDSNTITTSISAIDDGSITTVTSGAYKIVQNLTGKQITFHGNIFNIEYNSDNTFYSIGGEFSQIGTIGDSFTISYLQSNIGNAGIALDLISYDSGTGTIRLNNAPDLSGVNTDYLLIDSSGQNFKIVAVDDQPKPSVFYDSINYNSNLALEASGLGSQLAQGFKVPSTDKYAIVSLYLEKQGNIIGNLTAKIVNDSGGLPNLSSVVAVSNLVNVTSISDSAFQKVVFNFTVPPTLTATTQYHLVLVPDAGYIGAFDNTGISYSNSALVNFVYNSISGDVQYASAINLTNVKPGHYLEDKAANFFKILSVNVVGNSVNIGPSLTVSSGVPSTSDHGSIFIRDEILVGTNNPTPTYPDGELSLFDSTAWSNSTLGPSPTGILTAAIFTVEGTRSITVQSNLTPVMGKGATISTRYYDDNSEISLILGISNGTATSATDVNALGIGTVASVPNRPVDNFVFRTSRYADDIVNLRLNEIPQLASADIVINIYGGIS